MSGVQVPPPLPTPEPYPQKTAGMSLFHYGIPAKRDGLGGCPQPIHSPEVNATITTWGTNGLLGVLIMLAGAPGASMPLLEAETSKSAAQFGACFIQSAERGNRAWAFLPNGHGGTFTDFGAHGTPASYWLQVRSGAGPTRLRLFADAPVADVNEAVDKCR